MFVPYDTLTAKEKEKYRNKAYEMLRFIQFSGYILNKAGKGYFQNNNNTKRV